MNREEYFALQEKYKQIIDKAYNDYCNTFSDSIVEPNTKEVFIDKCKHNIIYSIRWGLKIEEKNLTREERYDLMPSLIGHHPGNIAMRKQINNFEGNIPGVSYHEEWLDSFWMPTKLITVTYNNETVEAYIYEASSAFDELIRTFVYETLAGGYVVIDPLAHDEIIGYYNTKPEAEQAFKEYVKAEEIKFL